MLLSGVNTTSQEKANDGHKVATEIFIFPLLQAIPSAVSASPPGKQGKRGHLWRLSTKRLVYTTEWKRKYCVLSGGGYLYYYESETSQGGERGSGVIDLRCVMDCVEAPLTDHKKATNVFILIAKQRGFFNQVIYTKGKCSLYL